MDGYFISVDFLSKGALMKFSLKSVKHNRCVQHWVVQVKIHSVPKSYMSDVMPGKCSTVSSDTTKVELL